MENLKANEIRVGNWVIDDTESGPFKIQNGWEIDEGNALYGVPLTEEWLTKFGFKREDEWSINRLTVNGSLFFMSDAFGQIRLGNNKHEEVLNYSCQYVHQLQNLYFALTQEELTIS